MRALATLLLVSCAGSAAADPPVQSGDLVLHTSRSAQSAIIAEVTGSPWTHVGVVFERDGEPWVLEAVEPVRWTRFDVWRQRGEGGRYGVRRPRAPLTEAQLRRLRRAGERHLGRHYDARFEWSDRRMYCSELVWKMYARGVRVRLSEPARWRDVALTPEARRLARRRLGRAPPPDGLVVTPDALARSPLLFDPVVETPR